MAGLFLQVAELSVSAAWMIPAVCALRLLLRRAPRWGLCLLWLPVGLRLVWPFSFGSALSLVPRAASHAPGAVLSGGAGAQIADAAGSVSGIAPAAEALEPLGLTNVLAALWLAGLAAMLLYAFLSWLRLRLLVREAVPAGDGKYICDRLRDPFILGLFRPRIYLPSDLSEPELGCVLAHEGAHLRRRDHIWKPLGWLLLSVHWFNPLVWLAYALFCRDVEYACDESVVGGLDADGRRAYARALLECSSPRRAAACAVLAVCFLTEPKPTEPALPEGLSLSEYEGDILCGGRMILPMVYEDMGSAPDYWRSSGVIADFNAAQCLRWEGEQIAEVLIYSNHMQIDNLGPVTGLSAPAYLTRNTYDLCTAAEAVGGEVPVSAYWCVYIAEPGASTGMLVSREASRFSAEDTVRLAQSLSR